MENCLRAAAAQYLPVIMQNNWRMDLKGRLRTHQLCAAAELIQGGLNISIGWIGFSAQKRRCSVQTEGQKKNHHRHQAHAQFVKISGHRIRCMSDALSLEIVHCYDAFLAQSFVEFCPTKPSEHREIPWTFASQ